MDNKFSPCIILNKYNFLFDFKLRSFKNLNCGQTCSKSKKGFEDWTHTSSFTWNSKNVDFLFISNLCEWFNLDLFSKRRAFHFLWNLKLGKVQSQFKRNFAYLICTWVVFSFISDLTWCFSDNGICCNSNGDQSYVEVILEPWMSR